MVPARFRVALCAIAAACGSGGRGTSDAAVTDALVDGAIADAIVDGRADAMPDAEVIPGGPPVGSCRAGWCWVYPLPQGNSLRAIWGASPTDVWALGDRATLMHYDGNAWTLYPSNSPSWGIFGRGQLWGTGSTDVWAAANTGGVLHWNGKAWSVAYAAGDARVIGGTGPHDVWAYDAAAKQIVQWNGSTWTAHGLPSWSGQPIAFGGEPGALIVVSDASGIAKWLGSSWSVLEPGISAATAATVIDSTHVVFVKNSGVDFWDGKTWTTHLGLVGLDWYRITARSFSDVWVGSTSNYRAHWNGNEWSSADDTRAIGTAQGLWEDSSGRLWAALDDAQVRVFDSTWSEKTVGYHNLTAVWGTAEDDIWATVPIWSDQHMLHWDGSSWTEVPLPSATDRLGGRFWGSARDDYWLPAGTANGTTVDRMLVHWDGSAWTASGPYGAEDASKQPSGFQGVWGAAANDVYAVGATALYHFDGNAWTQVPDVPGGTDVFGSGSSDVYVIAGTALWHWDGSQWSSTTMPSAEGYGWINGAGDVWLDGAGVDPGFHYDGTSFVQYATISIGTPAGTANDMFTFDGNTTDTMTEWIGGISGTSRTAAAPFVLYGGWRAPDGHVYAIGAGLQVR